MNKEKHIRNISRRNLLKSGGILMGGLLLQPHFSWAKDLMPDAKSRYRIGIADIMILKRQKIGAFALVKELGADGVEVDMGGLGDRDNFDNKLTEIQVQQQFLTAAKENNIQICSLAMTGFYSQPFATRPTWRQNIADCIRTMKAMNMKTAFLPMGVNSDVQKNPELKPALIQRLHVAGEMARAAGVVIGIETTLDAKNELQFLKEINSTGIKSYFNFANALDAGRDVSRELEILGKDNICQIHCTDTDGVLLQNDTKIDMKSVKRTLDKMRWRGWLVVQRSRDAQRVHDVKYNFSANTAYMKKIFQ